MKNLYLLPNHQPLGHGVSRNLKGQGFDELVLWYNVAYHFDIHYLPALSIYAKKERLADGLSSLLLDHHPLVHGVSSLIHVLYFRRHLLPSQP